MSSLHPITRNVLNRIAPTLPKRKDVKNDRIETHIFIGLHMKQHTVKVMFEWSDLGWVLLNPLLVNEGGDGTFEMGCVLCNEKVRYRINKDRTKIKAVGDDTAVNVKLW